MSAAVAHAPPSRAAIAIAGAAVFPAIFFPMHTLLALVLAALSLHTFAPARSRQLLDGIRDALADCSAQGFLPHLPWISFVVLVACAAFPSRYGGDDAMRHATAYLFDHDYTRHYAHSLWVHQWSWWWGFEAFFGMIHKASDGDVLLTIRSMRGTVALLAFGSVFLALRRLAPGKPALQSMALLLIGYALLPRITLGRPESLMFAILPAALYLPRAAWLAAAWALSPAYWFSPVWATAVTLFPAKSRSDLLINFAIGVVYCAGAVAFWWTYSDGQYFEIREHLALWLSRHEGLFTSTELESLQRAFAAPITLVALGALGVAMVTWLRDTAPLTEARQNAVRAAAACVFMALFFTWPNYVRYWNLILQFSLLAAVALLAHRHFAERHPGRALATWALTLCMVLATYPVGGPKAEEVDAIDFDFAPGTRVLTPFTTASYQITAFAPQARLTPNLDAGAIADSHRDLLYALHRNQPLDCEQLRRDFDYVYEDGLRGKPPACLSLVSASGNYRLWKVVQ